MIPSQHRKWALSFIAGFSAGFSMVGCSSDGPNGDPLGWQGGGQAECLVVQQQCRSDAYVEWERNDGSFGCACNQPKDPDLQAQRHLPDHR
ncbi:hypothetical protein KUV89_15485 [Marinobacter hydrocarbonoclasticus]|nr:hypothetical protein [Marinobacter nauticus]